MVGLPAAARTAWIDAVGHAEALDEHLPVLAAAAELAGVVIDADELLLPLVLRNVADLHRRKLWTAFDSATPQRSTKPWVTRKEAANQWTPPRCGRWSALAALGATVRAADLTAGELEPYRRPAPFDRREYPVKGQVGNRLRFSIPRMPITSSSLSAGTRRPPADPGDEPSAPRRFGSPSSLAPAIPGRRHAPNRCRRSAGCPKSCHLGISQYRNPCHSWDLGRTRRWSLRRSRARTRRAAPGIGALRLRWLVPPNQSWPPR